MSHPSRVCGLKYDQWIRTKEEQWSHPSRVCGLKFHSDHTTVEFYDVTPLAGVWIEICLMREEEGRRSVTPLAGVWIEILG